MAMVGLLFWSATYPALADQVYRSVDAHGHVTFSDRPVAAGARKTDVAVQQADAKEAERLAKESTLLKAEDDQRAQKAAADAKAKAQQDGEKKKLCEHARLQYSNLNSVNRIYAPTADGGREYFSDTQAEAMRNEAKRAMEAACGS
jgi:uncharacterized protein DUF4124